MSRLEGGASSLVSGPRGHTSGPVCLPQCRHLNATTGGLQFLVVFGILGFRAFLGFRGFCILGFRVHVHLGFRVHVQLFRTVKRLAVRSHCVLARCCASKLLEARREFASFQDSGIIDLNKDCQLQTTGRDRSILGSMF